MSLEIRAARPSDAAIVGAISVRAWRSAYRGLMPDAILAELSIERRAEQWLEWIATPASPELRVWVIARAGVVVGFAATGPSRDASPLAGTMELYALYIEPDEIGRGVGATIFRHAADDLARRGARSVTLWALVGNDVAARFYERMGMLRDGEKLETLRGAQLPHVRYRLALAATA